MLFVSLNDIKTKHINVSEDSSWTWLYAEFNSLITSFYQFYESSRKFTQELASENFHAMRVLVFIDVLHCAFFQ